MACFRPATFQCVQMIGAALVTCVLWGGACWGVSAQAQVDRDSNVARSSSGSSSGSTRRWENVFKDGGLESLVQYVKKSVVVISQKGRDGQVTGQGSGFIIQETGWVITNFHVIGEGRDLVVTDLNGSERRVNSIHAWDRDWDLAVLSVDGLEGTPGLDWAPIEGALQGTPVIALGSPQGLDYSATLGMISARREIEGLEMIQVAIPIEPGNSGGPLLDLQGRVCGVITMKSAITDNLGFAIPVERVLKLLEAPNPMSMEQWNRFGRLSPAVWTNVFDGGWRRQAGKIQVEGWSKGFGGRSLLLSEKEPDTIPFEVEVNVALDDESGAAGLVFGSDGSNRHYGFYPSAGSIRLTRFDGPDVFSWNILEQMQSQAYRPGEWNILKVRVEKDKIIGYINNVFAFENEDTAWRNGKVGLAQFRGTPARFKGFRFGPELQRLGPSEDEVQQSLVKLAELDWDKADINHLAREWATNANAVQIATTNRKRLLELELERLDELAKQTRLQAVYSEIVKRVVPSPVVADPEDGGKDLYKNSDTDLDLAEVALWIARIQNPDLEVELYLEELDRIAMEIGGGLEKCATQSDRMFALKNYFFEVAGYRGSRGDFYHPENSFLNEAMDDREGIPITLSVLFLSLGQRVGITGLSGVSAPGRFLVRWDHPNELQEQEKENTKAAGFQLLDIFDEGKEISQASARVLSWSISGAALSDDLLAPASGLEIATRMVRNLIGIHLSKREESKAIPYLNLALELNPESTEMRLQRAIAWIGLGKRDEAKEDLQWALDHSDGQYDYHEIRKLYDSL